MILSAPHPFTIVCGEGCCWRDTVLGLPFAGGRGLARGAGAGPHPPTARKGRRPCAGITAHSK